jgi:hypothetical protein
VLARTPADAIAGTATSYRDRRHTRCHDVLAATHRKRRSRFDRRDAESTVASRSMAAGIGLAARGIEARSTFGHDTFMDERKSRFDRSLGSTASPVVRSVDRSVRIAIVRYRAYRRERVISPHISIWLLTCR